MASGAVLVALAVIFATRPQAAFLAIDAAVASRDYATLNRLVDFPAVRASVKTGLQQELESRTTAKAGILLGGWMIGPLVDLAVSPIGLSLLLEGRTLAETASPAQKPGGPAPAETNITHAGRWVSLSLYEVAILRDGTTVSILALRRHGLFGWKLVGIDLSPWLGATR